MLQTQLVEKNNTIKRLGDTALSNENKVNELESFVTMLQQKIVDKNMEIQQLHSRIQAPRPAPSFTRIPIQMEDNDLTVKSKSDPEFTVSAED